MAGADGDDSLYPIAVLIDELRNEDVQVKPIAHNLKFCVGAMRWIAQLRRFLIHLETTR